jgi:hypothetical protein
MKYISGINKILSNADSIRLPKIACSKDTGQLIIEEWQVVETLINAPEK